jgi:hypothetical protein
MLEAIGGFDVVSADEWNAAREKLLAEEKALIQVSFLTLERNGPAGDL